jgi:hypothetical protein
MSVIRETSIFKTFNKVGNKYFIIDLGIIRIWIKSNLRLSCQTFLQSKYFSSFRGFSLSNFLIFDG